MLIVRQTNGRCTDFADQRHVLINIRIADHPALVTSILMLIHAMEIQIVSVQEKAVIGIQ